MIPLFAVPRRISWVTQAVLYISLSGFVLFLVVSLAMSKNRQSVSFIVQSGLGTSGWGDGTAWVLGITNAMYAFGGTDGGKRVPGWRLYLTVTLLTWRLAIHKWRNRPAWTACPSSHDHDHDYQFYNEFFLTVCVDVLHIRPTCCGKFSASQHGTGLSGVCIKGKHKMDQVIFWLLWVGLQTKVPPCSWVSGYGLST